MTDHQGSQPDKPVDSLDPGEDSRLIDLFEQLDHDLRTPLSTVDLTSWVVQTGPDDDKLQASGARLRRAAKLMTRLIDRAIDLARLASGDRATLDLHDTVLDELVHAVVDELREETGTELTIEVVPRGDVTGRWDADRLEGWLASLLRHSDGQVHLDIDGDTDDRVRLTVNFRGDLPSLETIHTETDNLDSLHMDIRYADVLTRAHGGSLHLSTDADRARLELELPRRPTPPR